MGYAKGTSVDVAKSRAEIDALLTKYKASSVGILNDIEHDRAVIAFGLGGARFRLEMPLPCLADVDREVLKIRPARWSYLNESQRREWKDARVMQLHRERWRAILLLIKSKLAVVDIGLSSVEREFMADLVLPGGQRAEVVFAEAIRRGLDAGVSAPLLLEDGERH